MNKIVASCKRQRGLLTQLWEGDVEHLCVGQVAADKKGEDRGKRPISG